MNIVYIILNLKHENYKHCGECRSLKNILMVVHIQVFFYKQWNKVHYWAEIIVVQISETYLNPLLLPS